MIASQPVSLLNGSEELFEGRMAQDSRQEESSFMKKESFFMNGIDWIEGTLLLSF